MLKDLLRAFAVLFSVGGWAGEPSAPPKAEVAAPTAEQVLAKYDAIMGPVSFDSEMQMSATREDGTSRTYSMRILKRDNDKMRIFFSEPASVKGQEMLRNGDNLWIYLPNLKRATRIASRDNFQGGDFNNADVLRVNYQADYTAQLAPSELPDTYLINLKAKNPETAYESIKLWVRKADYQPVRGQYFGTSGQMIRSAEFGEYQEVDKGYLRPTRITMHNELVKTRQSEMRVKKMSLNLDVPPQRFTQSDLGK